MIDVPEIWHQYVYYSGNSRTMALPNILKCMVLSYVLCFLSFFSPNAMKLLVPLYFIFAETSPLNY